MSDLTDDQVRALLDDPGEYGMDMHYMAVLHALLQARAAAAAAQALAYEAAAEFVGNEAPSFPDNVAWCVEDLAKAIRRFAPDAGTAELAKLRGERDILRADRDSAARMWQASEQEREAAVDRAREASQMLAIETNHAAQAEAERDTLAASLAQANLRARNAYMRGLLDSAMHLRSTIPANPDNREQVESMAQMLDAMASREAARHIAEGQAK